MGVGLLKQKVNDDVFGHLTKILTLKVSHFCIKGLQRLR